jgi:hypothetical protein
MSFGSKRKVFIVFIFCMLAVLLVWFYINVCGESEEMESFAAHVKKKIYSIEAKGVNSMVETGLVMFWSVEGAHIPMSYGMAGGGRGSFRPWNIFDPESRDLPPPDRMIPISAEGWLQNLILCFVKYMGILRENTRPFSASCLEKAIRGARVANFSDSKTSGQPPSISAYRYLVETLNRCLNEDKETDLFMKNWLSVVSVDVSSPEFAAIVSFSICTVDVYKPDMNFVTTRVDFSGSQKDISSKEALKFLIMELLEM